MNPEKVIIGCKAPLLAPSCNCFDENGCTKKMGECSFQYDFKAYWETEKTSIKKQTKRTGE